MFLKKNIILVGLLMITILLTTGCEWPNCIKNACKSCSINPKKENIVILEDESNEKENKIDLNDSEENEENEK